jgi:hypothetical protein
MSLKINQNSQLSSDECDNSHNICDTNREVHIKNSFDYWKGRVGEPYDPARAPEIIGHYNTNMTTIAQ